MHYDTQIFVYNEQNLQSILLINGHFISNTLLARLLPTVLYVFLFLLSIQTSSSLELNHVM